MQKHYLNLLLLLVLALIVAACQSTTTPTPAVVGTPIGTPVAGQPQLEAVPAPSSGLTTITGVILHGPNREPAANLAVFVAELVADSSGVPTVAQYSRTTSPYGITNTAGQFIISNVEAQPYQLILDNFSDAVLLPDPNTGLEIDIPVQAGQIINLGELYYPNLPIEVPPQP